MRGSDALFPNDFGRTCCIFFGNCEVVNTSAMLFMESHGNKLVPNNILHVKMNIKHCLLTLCHNYSFGFLLLVCKFFVVHWIEEQSLKWGIK